MGAVMKIFAITHKQFNPPKDKLYVPLHVGHERYLKTVLKPGDKDLGYLTDDTGDNISSKNNLYGELTGLYWIWKNCDEDYVGLVHYRRYFADDAGNILKEQDFKKILSEYDMIIGRHIEYDVSYAEKFGEYHNILDLRKTGEVIERIYPEYSDSFNEVIASNEQYVFNMFAAPKKLCDAYAKWLFDICFELEKVIDISRYDDYRERIYGFLAEELLFVWIKKNGLSYFEAPVIYSQEKAAGYEAAYNFFIENFKKRPVTAAIIYYDLSTADSVIEAVDRVFDAVSVFEAECIFIDAVGDDALLQVLDKKWPQMKIYGLGMKVYNTLSQIKNDALKLASNDCVVCVTTDMMLESNAFDNLFKVKTKFADNSFDELILKNDSDISLMAVSKQVLSMVGGWNEKLSCGEDYELALRVCGQGYDDLKYIKLPEYQRPLYREIYIAYSYMLSKYAVRLKERNIFDEAFMRMYSDAKSYGVCDYFVGNLETMIKQGAEFSEIDKNTRTVLIFMGEQICYGVLDDFAVKFAASLKAAGFAVNVINIKKSSKEELVGFATRKYRAVIGFQTGMFTTQLPDGRLYGNLFEAPKFNFVFDHPLFISYHLMLPVNDYYVLVQDITYAAYINEHFDYVKRAYHFPPAGSTGVLVESKSEDEIWSGKIYDVSFVGTYNDYRQRLPNIRKLEATERKIALKLLLEMKNHPNVSAEEVFSLSLNKLGVSMTNREFVVCMHHMLEVVRTVIFYYREKVVGSILDSGIELHVFSDSWKTSPFADNQNLIIHGGIDFEQSLDTMAQSRISLNIMSWHKGGMTERVANAMLNYSVCLSDKTSYLCSNFEDMEQIVLYDLENLSELGGRIKELLDNEVLLKDIAKKGHDVAVNAHTWKMRASEFAELLFDIEAL